MQSTGMSFAGLRLGFRTIMTARCVCVMAVVFLLIQSCVSLAGGHDEVQGLYLNFGLSKEGILKGKIWQLLTYGFLHGGLVHTALNVTCLLLIGSRVEHMLGAPGVLKVMIAGVLGGALAHLALTPGGSDAPILVGASGGCVALLILVTTLSPDSRMLPIPVSGRVLGAGLLAAALLLALINPQFGVPGLSKIGTRLEECGLGGWFDIGHACLLGGGLAVFLMGRWLLRPRVTSARLRRERERREGRQIRQD